MLGRARAKSRASAAGSTGTAAEIGEAEKPARKLARRAAEARAAEARLAADLADAAQRSGIADDGFGPVDTGDDLLMTARARVAARRDDVGEIRRLLQAIRDARARRGLRRAGPRPQADRRAGAGQASTTAAARLAQARQSGRSRTRRLDRPLGRADSSACPASAAAADAAGAGARRWSTSASPAPPA